MSSNNQSSITLLFDELLKLSNFITSENQETIFSELAEIYSKHTKMIAYISGDSSEIQEIKKIKKDKNYLKKYLSAFHQNLKFSSFIQDKKSIEKLQTNIAIFELFLNDVEKFYNFQTFIHTTIFYLQTKKFESKVLLRKAKKGTVSSKETLILKLYKVFTESYNSLKFFRCYPLTEKNIQTSLAISLYKYISKFPDISRYKAKEIVETFSYQIDMPTTIKINKLRNPHIKTIVNDLAVLSYPSSKNIDSLVDFEKIYASIIKSKNANASKSNFYKKRQQQYNDKYIKKVFSLFAFLKD